MVFNKSANLFEEHTYKAKNTKYVKYLTFLIEHIFAKIQQKKSKIQ